MSRIRLLSASAALLLVAACAPTLGPPPPPPPGGGPATAGVFRAEDFSWSAVPGSGRVDGRLTYKSGQTR